LGKIVTVYLTDDEASDLRSFCDENQCTQYSAQKTALRDLIYKPVKLEMEEEPTDHEDEPMEVQPSEVGTEEGTIKEKEQVKKEETSTVDSILRRLVEKYQERSGE